MVYSILVKYGIQYSVMYGMQLLALLAQAYYTITYQAFVIVPINWYFPPHRV